MIHCELCQRETKYYGPKRPCVRALCSWCGTPTIVSTDLQWELFRRGRAYCRPECRDAYRSKCSSETASNTNRRFASARMKARNPMRLPEVRAKQSATLRAIGHRPKIRGGNGRPLPVPQKMLADALGWPTEVAIPTKARRHTGLPTCYKIDIADRSLQIAIEVDGNTHNSPSRRAEDQRKEQFLRGLGWRVFRFTNAEVMEHLADCVQAVRSST